VSSAAPSAFAQCFFHGTKADLCPGDTIVTGHRSNFTAEGALSWSYFTATLDAAIWGAELARGAGQPRIYVVEPTGPFEDDPNLTDKKFPGNPTKAYRTRDPLRIVGEVIGWHGHAPEAIAAMKEGVARITAEDPAAIID
jgi:rifampin ADP-ribosylating transferase